MMFVNPLDFVVSHVILNVVSKREWIRTMSREREVDFDTRPVLGDALKAIVRRVHNAEPPNLEPKVVTHVSDDSSVTIGRVHPQFRTSPSGSARYWSRSAWSPTISRRASPTPRGSPSTSPTSPSRSRSSTSCSYFPPNVWPSGRPTTPRPTVYCLRSGRVSLPGSWVTLSCWSDSAESSS